MFGYVFRFVFIIICVVILIFSLRSLLKKDGFKTKILHISSVCVCLILVFLSFWSADINTPKVNSNLSQGISLIISNCLPNNNNTHEYYVYKYDCHSYFGTVAVSKINSENTKHFNEKFYTLKIEDGESLGWCSKVYCDRDLYGLPNISIGSITLFQGDVRIFIKYTYKDKKVMGPIKYLTFPQYFFRDTIDIKEIANSIDFDSLIIMNQSGDGSVIEP